MVVLGHLNPDKGRIVNEAPTIHRSSVSFLVALYIACFQNLFTRDVNQSFVQLDDDLKRELYILPPNSQNVLEIIWALPSSFLKVVKPLYWMPESPRYWWSTFLNHHVTVLSIKQSVLDPCLFFNVDDRNLSGVQGTLVDDTIATESELSVALEDDAAKRFEYKAKSATRPVVFWRVLISDDLRTSEGALTLSKFVYTAGIEKLSLDATLEELVNAL